jgi:hypothetical protein
LPVFLFGTLGWSAVLMSDGCTLLAWGPTVEYREMLDALFLLAVSALVLAGAASALPYAGVWSSGYTMKNEMDFLSCFPDAGLIDFDDKRRRLPDLTFKFPGFERVGQERCDDDFFEDIWGEDRIG